MPKSFLLKRRKQPSPVFLENSQMQKEPFAERLPSTGGESAYISYISTTTRPSIREISPSFIGRSPFPSGDMNHNILTSFSEFPDLISPFNHFKRQMKADELNLDFMRENELSKLRVEGVCKKGDSEKGARKADTHAAHFHFAPNAGKKMPSTKILEDDVKQPLKCEQCGKIFKTKYTLAIHLKMPSHTNARPFVCGTCGKGFRLSSTLCRHKIIHTSAKPHRCQICQKAFNRSSTLKTHVRTHSDVKEFMCEVCGKGFHQKGNLRNHALIHTGEKPYRCRLCEKAFNKLSNLKFHMHIHTDNAPYRCRYCKVSFSRRCDLKHHLSAIHKKDLMVPSP